MLVTRRMLRALVFPLLLLIAANFCFSLLYLSGNFIDKPRLINQLRNAEISGVLTTPPWSIGRATTGWGIDYGTECIALGMNLSDDQYNHEGIRTRFYDSYLQKGTNSPGLDPCGGLSDVLNNTKDRYPPGTYLRNWWGISIFSQFMVIFFGLAQFKLIIGVLNLIAIALIFRNFSQRIKTKNPFKTIFLLLFPFMALSDFIEIHNSFPHSIATLLMFCTVIGIERLTRKKNLGLTSIAFFAIISGAIYNFSFWILPQNVLIMGVGALLLLGYSETIPFISILKQISVFGIYWIIGFIGSTIIKWIISLFLFGNEVTSGIRSALSLRLSQGNIGLNTPLQNYLGGLGGRPLWFNSILINYAAFFQKLVDPRYSGLILVVAIIVFFNLALGLLFISKIRKIVRSGNSYDLGIFAINAAVLLSPALYYAITANHSFNHATMTFRSIPISIGIFLAMCDQMGKPKIELSD
jgi:hypothetical protein